MRGTDIMMRSSVVTDTWLALERGFSFPGVGSYASQKGCDFTAEPSDENVSEQ